MLVFCPNCHNLLIIESSFQGNRFSCSTCPYVNYIDRVTQRTFPKLKEIDDVLGGEESWKNVDATDAECSKCGHNRAYFMQLQTRSADEPMTTFYRCCKCSYQWRD